MSYGALRYVKVHYGSLEQVASRAVRTRYGTL